MSSPNQPTATVREALEAITDQFTQPGTKYLRDLNDQILELLAAETKRVAIEARIEAYKHLNRTYWDDKTDSIPCKDIDAEIERELNKLDNGSK